MPTLEIPPTPPAIVRRCKRPMCSPVGLLAQLLPNLLIGADARGAYIGGRLRLSPLVLSLGMVGGPRWRAFAVEPLERNAGSLEVVVQGELFHRDRGGGVVRAMLVGTFPLLERGEQLSMSIGAGVATDLRSAHATGELGLYTMSGIFGVTITISPYLRAPLAVVGLVMKLF